MGATAPRGADEVERAAERYALAEEDLARRCGAARDSLRLAGAGRLALEIDAVARRSGRRRRRLVTAASGVGTGGSGSPGRTVPAARGARSRDGDRDAGADGGGRARVDSVADAARASVAGVDALALCRDALFAMGTAGGPLRAALERALGELQEDAARLVGVVREALAWETSVGTARQICGVDRRDE